MGNRSVVLVAVGSISFALLAGCNDSSAPDPNSEAFKGPFTTELIVSSNSDCPPQVGYGDTVVVRGFDYIPGTIVDLRWTDLNTDATSALDSVTANKSGNFQTTIKIVREMAKPGERLRISSEGSSESGILVLDAELHVANC